MYKSQFHKCILFCAFMTKHLRNNESRIAIYIYDEKNILILHIISTVINHRGNYCSFPKNKSSLY